MNRRTVLTLSAFASAALCIAAGIELLPLSLSFVFKPLTTVLVIAYAWQRGNDIPRQRRLILTGLVLSLAGDVFLLWPEQGFLPGLVSFLLAHLAYIAAFCVPVRLAARPVYFALYALVAAAILAWLWAGVPGTLHAPVIAYVACLAAMAAQATIWWRSAPTTNARWAALGGVLFMVSDTLLAFNRFAAPLPLSALWILATYWLAQWCIASAMQEKSRSTEVIDDAWCSFSAVEHGGLRAGAGAGKFLRRSFRASD